MIIKCKKLMRPQERIKKILELQQMEAMGLVLLDDEYELVPESNTWYRLKDALPTEYAEIIFCDKDGVLYIGTMDSLKRFIDRSGESIQDVVAWMPAPEAYEEEE